MVFTTGFFLFAFLGATLALYALAPRAGRTLLLTAASFVFYGWWRPDFVLLMLFSAGVDWWLGGRIARSEVPRTRNRLLFLSCAVNLGLLAWFKYADFGIASLNGILAGLGLPPMPLLGIVLPVGISFYTFQSMSYTIDVWRREVEPVKGPVDFLCYVSFFPQLVAGPIVRYRDVADQLRSRTHTLGKLASGALLFQIGFAKKVLVADMVAPLADAAFDLPDPSTSEAWVGTLAYAFQIYFDFSGYSDMAIGLGLLFGFEFPVNFDAPYKSRSVTEFWRRWHITLSTWLRDYLYIPLGGNRRGPARTTVNLLLTMLLGGLWHGAAWTFVAWGAWQGVWLVVERLAGKRAPWAALPGPLAVAATFVVTLGGWVFFRAATLDQAGAVLAAMGGFGAGSATPFRLPLDPAATGFLLLAAVLAFGAPTSQRLVERASWAVSCAAPACFLAAVGHMWFQAFRPFLYFQF